MFAVGCANPAEQKANLAVNLFFAGDYEGARQILDPLAKKTDGDFVLNNARLGSTCMAEYRLDDAEVAFLRAYEVINSVGVNDGGRSLGAVLISENVKVWKGEPFERAMVNFYLGLSYYMRQDYNNARAAFENALFKLRDYGEEKGASGNDEKYAEVESNFTLGYLMLGKCYQHLGRDDKAKDQFDRLARLRPDLAALADPELNKNANLLLVVDYGAGPQKKTDFDGSVTGFGPKPIEAGPIECPLVMVDGHPMPTQGIARPPVDLLALAQDQRWQSIDTIRVTKSVVGEGLMAAGAYEAFGRRRSDPAAAAALLATGLLLKATSAPDLRQWEMLPRTTFVIPMVVPAGTHSVTIDFPGGLRQTWTNLTTTAGTETTYYMRATRTAVGTFNWPPPALGLPPAETK